MSVKMVKNEKKFDRDSAGCFTSFDQCSKMIIFKSILTTFIASVIFCGRWDRGENWLELKIEPPKANSACLNW
jgi:hypothetical protein